ncbi:MAG: RIP metalloprotease RseP [Spirochaetales bacterium]|nr:RIP metalloprotease RseP [Spirochaetales bacterium]
MVNVLIGLIGLGLVVFIHELGHLVAAKWAGVTVEAFSVGWGRKIWSFTRGGTEYRISWLPIGGYCKMQGEQALSRAWQDRSAHIDVREGDFYAARPWKRIVILIAGPAVNFIFAVIVFAIVSIIGQSIQTFPNRIVLASDYDAPASVATRAGLETGDRILAIDGESVETFRDLQTTIGQSADRELILTVLRDGAEREVSLVPDLDPATGIGFIGVYPWVEPVVAAVGADTPAAIAGIQAGDRIVAVRLESPEAASREDSTVSVTSDGVREIDTPHSIAIEHAMATAGNRRVSVRAERDGRVRELAVVPEVDENGAVRLGISYETIEVAPPEYGLVGGAVEGFRQAAQTLRLSIRGIGLLFSGVDVNQAVMGPVRITYLVGEVATTGLASGIGRGLLSFFNFLSFISITLFFMNLLPIPVLDGGQILLTVVEIMRRKPLNPRVIYRLQVVGSVIIIGLMFFAFFNDILFFARG